MKCLRQKYHWIIALLAFLEMLIYGGLLNSTSVFIIPITESLQITRGSYALAILPYSAASTVSVLFSGFLLQRFGYRRCIIGGLLLTAVSLVWTVSCKTLVSFCLSKVLLGLTEGVCFTAGVVWIVKNWFIQHKGLVISAISMASGLGGSLMTLILTRLMEAFGWRIACIFPALLIGILVIGYLLLIHDRPEELALQPYGYGVPAKSTKQPVAQALWPGLTFRQWCRHPLLYLMVFATLGSCFAIYLTSPNLFPHFQDLGISLSEAAGYQSFYLLALAAAKLLCGSITDKLGAKPVAILCLLCGLSGQLFLRSPASPALCYLGVTLHGIGLCMTSVMIPLLGMELFGYRSSSSVNSITLAMVSLANALANPLSNLVFDRCGSYCPVFGGAALLNGVLVAVYLLMFLLAKHEKAKSGQVL